MNDTPAHSTVVALVKDLLLGSNIVAAARGAGVSFKVVRDPARLSESAGVLLLVDLQLPGALQAATAWMSASPGRRVVGFSAHTDTQAMLDAQEAGLTQVLTRGAFTAGLPEILRELA